MNVLGMNSGRDTCISLVADEPADLPDRCGASISEGCDDLPITQVFIAFLLRVRQC
jgi:hypothetical protein